jgi:3-isopropylmalate/(R)-2-methylmalate dehydratase small subunit
METRFAGKAWVFGDNVDTDQIAPGKYLTMITAEELGKVVLEGARPEFAKNVKKGDLIVAGRNFGCGSSREHAPVGIKGAGVPVVLAESFARIFYRNAINIGLAVIQCDALYDAVTEGDPICVDVRSGEIRTNGKMFKGDRPGAVAMAIMEAGTLIDLIKTRGWAAIEEVS